MSQDKVRFQTPEDVDLEFDLAGPASRIGAALIDYTIIALIMLFLFLLVVGSGYVSITLDQLILGDASDELAKLLTGFVAVSLLVLNVGYFIGCEWFLSGQSVGKRMLDLRVVRDGGYALDFQASLLRNVARLVDMLPGIYFVGILAVMLSKTRKRLGDQIAGTIVIRSESAAAPIALFPGETYARFDGKQFHLNREHIEKVGPKELQLLDDYYRRANALEEEAREQLTLQLATNLGERIDLDADLVRQHPEAALKEVYLALRDALS